MILPLVFLVSLFTSFATTQVTPTYFQKPGRCITQPTKCPHPSPDSRCIFHFDCPGSQLCCSLDGCLNACMDPPVDSAAPDLDTINMSAVGIDNSTDTNSTATASTGDAYFSCRTGLRISRRYRCNGHVDCPGKDNSDEVDCPCSEQQSLCANGICLDTVELCNPELGNAVKCPVANLNCSGVTCSESTSFQCRNSQCIPKTARCDGAFHCLDGSDEENCVCNAGNFVCDSSLCKSLLNTWCNGVADCQDQTDEPKNCTCVPGQFQCANGRCIPQYLQCDLTDNCLDGSDESNCSISCTTDNGLFQCTNGSCISDAQKCDGTPDCLDRSDEASCPAPREDIGNSCLHSGHFSCGAPHANFCVPLTAWCDQVTDCENQSDEPENCSLTCPTTSFQCDGLRCLSLLSRCDGKTECLDKTDESDCPCLSDQIPLPGSACLNSSLLCNGVRDAADGVDEESCTCKDRLRRTSPKKLCDGIVDCPDSSDEMSCGNCTTSQYYCAKSRQCVFRNQTCDGLSDCSQGEDEENCLGMVPQPCHITTSMEVRQERAGCLAVNNRGDWIPVCAERWSSSLSDAICEIMGYDKSILTNLLAMEPTEVPVRSTDQKIPRAIDGPQIVISASKSCPSRKKVYIECGSLTCGQGASSDFGQSPPPGSRDVPDGKYPWTAALYQNGKFICAATLIDQNWIITAAHCVAGLDNAFLVARVGLTRRGSLNSNEQFISIDQVTVHPDYRLSQTVDILSVTADLALLHLSVPAHWNSRVKPVCLPPTTSELTDTVTLAGWEQTRGKKTFLAGESLREVSVNTVSSSKCQSNPLVESSLANGTFCVDFSATSRNSCNVDDGGAALEKNEFGRWSVVGVMSFALGCDTANAVAGYTNIASYSDWIANVTTGQDVNITKSTNTECPGGVRCALGQCLNPSQICDGTIDCELGTDELNCSRLVATNSSVNCTFNDASLCGYRQDLSDQLNWFRGSVLANSTEFPSLSQNMTVGMPYVYISKRISNTATGNSARLVSPRLPSASGPRCLSVNYAALDGGLLAVYDVADSNRILPVFAETQEESGWSRRKMDLAGSIMAFVVDGRLSAGNGSLVAIASLQLRMGFCNTTIVLV